MADKWEETRGVGVKDNWDDEEALDNVKDTWDEEEDPKDNWDDEETAKVKAVTKKQPTAKKPVKEMTEEEKKEAQIIADLDHTKELFGVQKSLDEFSLETKEEYQDYVNRLYGKINVYNKSTLFNEFLDELFKSLTKNLPSDAVRKLSNSLKILADAKQAEERANLKTKDTKKPKSKGKIKLEADRIKGDFDVFLKDSHRSGGADFDEDEDDDFM